MCHVGEPAVLPHEKDLHVDVKPLRESSMPESVLVLMSGHLQRGKLDPVVEIRPATEVDDGEMALKPDAVNVGLLYTDVRLI